MASDPYLLERIQRILKTKKVTWTQKNMFGGTCYMVDDKMCFGPFNGGLMLRLDPEDTANHVQKKGASQMIHGGRPMKGYIFLEPDGFDLDQDLEDWIQACLEFNPKAKASKKKLRS